MPDAERVERCEKFSREPCPHEDTPEIWWAGSCARCVTAFVEREVAAFAESVKCLRTSPGDDACTCFLEPPELCEAQCPFCKASDIVTAAIRARGAK